MNSYRQEWAILLILLLGTHAPRAQQVTYVRQTIADGILEGVVSADGQVRAFKGIPYAAPPVGPLRWKAPQPVVPWTGVRKAADYAPRAMQGRIYNDMIFHDAGPSEDCLYLNLWIPAHPAVPRLPVMVWIHGGGFIAGSSSEPRQDGGNLCQKGRGGGQHELPHGRISGSSRIPNSPENPGMRRRAITGLLDQLAALQWVKKNIAAFGGDPRNVTIFGESAGSFSVSALMASPLAKGLFRRAIGESGAFFGATLPLLPRAQAEESGAKFAESALGAPTLEALRAKPAQEVLDAALRQPQFAFRPIMDGYFLPADAPSLYTAGRQSHVPLLAGWNRDEGKFQDFT